MRILLSVLAFYLLANAAGAQQNPCANINDNSERLTCYDNRIIERDPNDQVDPLDIRISQDISTSRHWYAISSHRPNYLLPATYNFSRDFSDYQALGDLFSDTEIKFQLSLKAPLWRNLWRDSLIWLAYTQQSYWQLYADSDASSPFRETNHEPEVIWDIPVKFHVLGVNAKRAWLTFTHESNGRSEPLSRSWNRVTGTLFFEKKRFVLTAKSWFRVDGSKNDDNPNIENYMGRLRLGLVYKGKHNTVSVNLKNNLSQRNKSGIEIAWSRPVKEHFKWYVQVYSGYGENLIDMENYNNRVGIGFALTDWL